MSCPSVRGKTMGIEKTPREKPQKSKLTQANIDVIRGLADNRMSIGATAKAIYMCGNNVRYHIKQIKEKTGLDPQDFYDLCALCDMVIADRMKEARQ